MPVKLEPEVIEPNYELQDECHLQLKKPSTTSTSAEINTSRNKHHHQHSSRTDQPVKEEKKPRSSDSKKSSDSKHHKKDHSRSSHHDHSTSSKRKHEEISHESKENDASQKKPKIEIETKKESSSSSKSHDNRSSSHHSKTTSSKSKEPSSSSSSKPKLEKPTKKIQTEEAEEEMDGSQGMGFAEALALFDMPTTSKKKDLQLADKIIKVKSSSSSHSSRTETKSTSSSEDTKKSLKSLTAPPKLLTQKPKLEPLPDIVSDLPSDVSIPDYRPMPLSSAVKDYINSHVHGSSYNSRPQIQKTDVELLFESFSSKANRTKVYSGNRIQKNVPSLFESCIRVLQENIDFIENTGGVPFDILRPVLERAKPEQLNTIEYHNPYLLDESDVLWEPHCKRKFRTRKRLEMETWREMYERCTTEDEEKLNRLTQNIKQHQETSSNGVQKTKLAFVDSMVKPPRGVMRKQEIYGTNRKLVVSPAARTVGLRHMAPNLAAAGDARLRIAAGIRDDAQNSE